MKKHLLIVLVALIAGCGKDTDTAPKQKTGATISVYRQDKLSTGEMREVSVTAITYVWKADGRDFEIKENDILKGYAYDKVSGKSIMYAYTGGRNINQEMPPGRYFVYTLLADANDSGRFAYSHTYFTVDAEWVKIKKVFSYDVKSYSFEAWQQ